MFRGLNCFKENQMAISILDMTAGQVERVERQVGLPLTDWNECKSLVALYTAILSAYHNEPVEKYQSMTLRDLMANVVLDMDIESDDPLESNKHEI
jgi:hypothetical protein